MAKPIGGAGRPAKYGQCYWYWLGIKGNGTWVKIINPKVLKVLVKLFGKTCRFGCKCPDPNKMGLQGQYLFELMIIHCQKRHLRGVAIGNGGCESCYCGYMSIGGGAFSPVPGYTTCSDGQGGNCGGGCSCNSPCPMIKRLAASGDLPPGAMIMTLCS
jgi:hypothetical protein